MKKRILSLLLALVAVSTALSGFAVQTQAKKSNQNLQLNSVQQFGSSLLKQNLEETNPVLSPVSAYAVLSMVGEGAKGATKKEFHAVLGSDMYSVSGNLMQTLPQQEERLQLSVANSVWMDTKFTPKKKWLEATENELLSEVFRENLDTEQTKDKINKWVSDRTNQLIPNLLKEKLDKDARLALVNALYFHADWKQQFVPEFTQESEFRLDDGNVEKTELMNGLIRGCGYLKDDETVGVVLPYEGERFAFVAVRPKGNENIREWYQSYTDKKMAALIKNRKTKEVELTLPKFKVRCTLDLKDSLKKVGLKKVFDEEKSDLSLLGKSSKNENLFLSMIFQEAVISVAEDGTEAAAATFGAVAAATSLVMEKPPVVRFDRSFLYMIMDMETGVPVFMGIMDNPNYTRVR